MTQQERLQYFISAVEFIKENYANELNAFIAVSECCRGMMTQYFSMDTENYKGYIEVIAGDGLVVYQSANHGILCEGISRSTGIGFHGLTHFDSLDVLNDLLENHG